MLRFDALPSPDGRWIAHHDKDMKLFVLDRESGEERLVDRNTIGVFTDLAWSPDGRWLAYVAVADNLMRRVHLYSVDDQRVTTATTDRFETYSPAWSPDGKWLYVHE